jgi:ATP-dependent Lon protease
MAKKKTVRPRNGEPSGTEDAETKPPSGRTKVTAKKGKPSKPKADDDRGDKEPAKQPGSRRRSRSSAARRPRVKGGKAGNGSSGTMPQPSGELVASLRALPPDHVVVVAVRGMILFPGVVLPVVVGRPRSVLAVQAAIQSERSIGLLLQKSAQDEEPPPEALHDVGTLAEIVRYVTAPDGSHHVIVQGRQRFRIEEFVRTEPFLVARVRTFDEPQVDPADADLQARVLALKAQAHEALELLPEKPEELDQAIQAQGSAPALTDLIATFIDVPAAEKQAVLETFELAPRMELVSTKLAQLVKVLSLSKEIHQRTRGTLEKAQREYFLREQLKTIQKELGEGGAPELAELAQSIDSAGMPEEMHAEAKKQLARLERMPEAAAEYSSLRSFLEFLVELPWSVSTQDAIDLTEARRILDEDHYGLDKVKRRIIEFLAVRKLKPRGKGPILCLVGPPGVGKTSLGQSIARAMGRKFVRLSLGGVHDEAEIRGHRRTYVGALPGNIVQSLKKAGSMNPVLLLDEMDKLGRGFQGDPSAALLEVLDPEQNRAFRDHYLGVPIDLSRVLFVATANLLEGIPGPLRDRCEVIELSGYTEEEKLQIARRYLVARQLDANGLDSERCTISDAALTTIASRYTREAGCRNLEREIGAVLRHAATRIAEGTTERVEIGPEDLAPILGPPKFESETAMRTSIPGVATGLAWTAAGGDILFIEATRMPGKGELVLTGQLGDVMKESAMAALSLVKSKTAELGLGAEPLAGHDIHVHFPAGAIPKDGPSAGVTVVTALVSLLCGRTVRSDVAMTGEISLRGLVLPVGGIKDKVLAAYRAGIRTVVLPSRNRKDQEEIPQSVRDNLRLCFVERIEEVLAEAIEGWSVPIESPQPARPRGTSERVQKDSAEGENGAEGSGRGAAERASADKSRRT